MKRVYIAILLIVFGVSNSKAQSSSCNNLDFSVGNLSNWVGQWNNAGSSGDTSSPLVNSGAPFGYGALNVVGFNSSGFNSIGYVQELCNGGIDPIVPISIVPPGYAYSLRLGNDSPYVNHINGGSINPFNHQTVSNTFPVSISNQSITIWYAVVLDQSVTAPHPPSEQPYFCIKMYDATGVEIPCAKYCIDLSATASIGGFDSLTDPTGEYEFFYKNWTPITVSLFPYVGTNVTLTFETSDCALGGHFCYAYVYADCNATNLIRASNVLCAGGSTTLLGMPGMATYKWSGPVTGSTQNLVTGTAGNYTLTTTPIMGCDTETVSYTLTQTTTASPTVSIHVLNDTICGGDTIVLTANGANTYTWSSGAITSSISISPYSSIAYTVTGIDTTNGCGNTAMETIYTKTCSVSGI